MNAASALSRPALILGLVVIASLLIYSRGGVMATIEAHPMSAADVSFAEVESRESFSGRRSVETVDIWGGGSYEVNELIITYAIPEGRMEEAMIELQAAGEALGHSFEPSRLPVGLRAQAVHRCPGISITLTAQSSNNTIRMKLSA